MTPHGRLSIIAGVIIGLSWLTITFIEPDLPDPLEEAGIGYFLGTLFAHITLAAAWAAFGPGNLILRIPLSAFWLVLVICGIFANLTVNNGPDAFIAVIAVCLIGQYFVLMLPFLLLAFGFRIGVQHHSEVATDAAKGLQFGIAHLMVITAVVAGLMGLGRLGVAFFPRGGEYPVFIFLVVAAIIQSVPLLLAALLRRFAIPAAIAIVLLIGFATWWEGSLLQMLKLGPGPNLYHLIFINLFTALFTLIIALIIRLNGFFLSMRGPAEAR